MDALEYIRNQVILIIRDLLANQHTTSQSKINPFFNKRGEMVKLLLERNLATITIVSNTIDTQPDQGSSLAMPECLNSANMQLCKRGWE